MTALQCGTTFDSLQDCFDHAIDYLEPDGHYLRRTKFVPGYLLELRCERARSRDGGQGAGTLRACSFALVAQRETSGDPISPIKVLELVGHQSAASDEIQGFESQTADGGLVDTGFKKSKKGRSKRGGRDDDGWSNGRTATPPPYIPGPEDLTITREYKQWKTVLNVDSVDDLSFWKSSLPQGPDHFDLWGWHPLDSEGNKLDFKSKKRPVKAVTSLELLERVTTSNGVGQSRARFKSTADNESHANDARPKKRVRFRDRIASSPVASAWDPMELDEGRSTGDNNDGGFELDASETEADLTDTIQQPDTDNRILVTHQGHIESNERNTSSKAVDTRALAAGLQAIGSGTGLGIGFSDEQKVTPETEDGGLYSAETKRLVNVVSAKVSMNNEASSTVAKGFPKENGALQDEPPSPVMTRSDQEASQRAQKATPKTTSTTSTTAASKTTLSFLVREAERDVNDCYQPTRPIIQINTTLSHDERPRGIQNASLSGEKPIDNSLPPGAYVRPRRLVRTVNARERSRSLSDSVQQAFELAPIVEDLQPKLEPLDSILPTPVSAHSAPSPALNQDSANSGQHATTPADSNNNSWLQTRQDVKRLRDVLFWKQERSDILYSSENIADKLTVLTSFGFNFELNHVYAELLRNKPDRRRLVQPLHELVRAGGTSLFHQVSFAKQFDEGFVQASKALYDRELSSRELEWIEANDRPLWTLIGEMAKKSFAFPEAATSLVAY
ncbi:hypothetical protein OIO90_006570 [Microbotryomycetes sp. JL221]|nr:hypothetical protein OIO90_006570 [Microbotryomycetes sp. JL221]